MELSVKGGVCRLKELRRWIMKNGKSLELFAIQVRSIWHQRHQTRLQQPCYLTKDLKQVAKERWKEIKSVKPLQYQSRPQPKSKWIAPPLNKYKINYDGAISSAENKSGVGVVVRDCSG